ncbi:MAG: glycosyltransferase family 4 protein [Planctomycetota bacterium]|jgi:glycosyltransferase involved in cell wall biosynthesis
MIALNKQKKKIAFISSYLPRKCGIATFTSDLINNMKSASDEEFEPQVFAMQSENELQYHKLVNFKIRKNVKHDYVSAADYINSSDIDVVSVQHEFGLFGGVGGSYISVLLKRLNKPVVTTLHTVLEKPSTEYFCSLINVCEASDKIIVMNKRGIRMLQGIYGMPESKVELIPHGIPDLPLAESNCYKHRLGMAGRKTILTFGLLSKNKGIEVMLRALPTIIKAEPTILYIILGATHPEVLRHEGQSYKLKLESIVSELGLERNVVFHNRFVEDKELFQFLGAADIYVTPYLHREQLTSGTLAFAVGAGKAVVSTPYWAAQELLAQGRGKFVRFGDPGHIAQSIVEILGNNSLFSRMKRQAYEYGNSMTWPKIGQTYWKLFRTYIPSIPTHSRPSFDLPDWAMPAYNPLKSRLTVRSDRENEPVHQSA